ncbi:MAG: shikimate kinase [Betaproteobacteria bacterium]|nr:MAG: shikimate kinase [Betaproteobacteria bacterium]
MKKTNHTTKKVGSNIILVGMMGAGKTTVGKSLASYLNKTFIDTDHEIQKRTGVKIPVIFEIEGEAGFRKREAKMLRELLKIDNIVLATGGGIILNRENRELLRQNGTIVYLRATVNDLWHRTRHNKDRPLLQTLDLQAKLAELYDQRDPIYREIAHIVVESRKQSIRQMVKLLVQQLAYSALRVNQTKTSTL